jgi:hypothetical protein
MSRRDGEDSVHFGLDDGIEIHELGTGVPGGELPMDSAVRGSALVSKAWTRCSNVSTYDVSHGVS